MILLRNCRRRRKQRAVIERLASKLWLPTLWLPMSPGYPCCCENCYYEKDEFDRDNSTNLGSKWTEVAQDWSITDNSLRVSSSGALVTCTSAGSVPYVVDINILGGLSDAGDLVRIIVDYTDVDNYIFVEIEQGASGSVTLNERSGGSDTEKDSTSHSTGGGTYGVRVCVTSSRITAFIGTISVSTARVWTEDLTPTTGTVGLGTGSITGGTAAFDDFEFRKHRDTLAKCPYCTLPCNRCDDEVMPQELELTLANVQNGVICPDCSDYNDTFILKWYPDALPDCDWIYNIDLAGALCPDNLEVWISSDYVLDILLGSTRHFRKDFGETKPVCSEWNNLDIPEDSISANACDTVSGPATATLSAVA